jgi:hypothetical protein
LRANNDSGREKFPKFYFRNKGDEISNKIGSSKNHIKMKRNRIVRATQDKNTAIQNVCTVMGFIMQIKVTEYGPYACSVTAGAINNVRKQLKSGDLCAETVIKQGKIMPKKNCSHHRKF